MALLVVPTLVLTETGKAVDQQEEKDFDPEMEKQIQAPAPTTLEPKSFSSSLKEKEWCSKSPAPTQKLKKKIAKS